MPTMRTPMDIGIELRTRDCHMRQYLGTSRFDVWADGKCFGSFTSPQEAEACVRNLLGVTIEEGALLDEFVAKLRRGEVSTEAN